MRPNHFPKATCLTFLAQLCDYRPIYHGNYWPQATETAKRSFCPSMTELTSRQLNLAWSTTIPAVRPSPSSR